MSYHFEQAENNQSISFEPYRKVLEYELVFDKKRHQYISMIMTVIRYQRILYAEDFLEKLTGEV